MKKLFLIVMIALLGLLTAPLAFGVSHVPGIEGTGPFGPTCFCPSVWFANCGCANPEVL